MASRRSLCLAPLFLSSVAAVVVVASCSVVNSVDDPSDPGGGGGGTSSSSSGGGSGGGGGLPGCGDGEVEAPETCDDGGESATCDGDCTVVECLDGEHNATAGEECDDGAESAACDADCTAVVCGDGTANGTAGEECDDSNIVSDDGCSADCAIEGVCADPVALNLTDNGSGVLTAQVTASTGGPSFVPAADCDGQSNIGQGSDRVYELTLTEASSVHISASSQSFDVIVRLLTAACNAATEIAEDGQGADGCADVGDIGAQEELAYTNLEAGTTYILIDGAGPDDVGSFVLDVEVFTTVFDCLDAQSKFPGMSSGVFSIDPDGGGGEAPFDNYCDMDTDGGGWTLIARFSNADAKDWMLDTGDWWYDKVTVAGDPTSRGLNTDMISPAFWLVSGGELKISRSDNADDAHLLMTNASCLNSQTFRAFITAFGDFRNSAIWGADSVAGTCAASLGNNYASTGGFAQATCTGDIGAANSISFWSDWSSGDGAVMMIGGGGSVCNRADHGIGVTEANDASFNDGSVGENDFGDDAGSGPTGYALNLFVR